MVACVDSHQKEHGWERPGPRNELTRRPYIEGAWMTKHNGKYYMQYAAPGTEWDSYADGVCVGDSPLGPFRHAANNPTSYKPSGFIGGAGHGCLFTAGGQLWKAATNSISVRHMFERRISFYPSAFDADGLLHTDTTFGDYPMFLPGSPEAATARGPNWMLLSYRKPTTVSSTLEGFSPDSLTDENVRTAWVAQSAGAEWVQIDLQAEQTICAIQVNYDEYGVNQKGRNPAHRQQYTIEASADGKTWSTVIDNRQKTTDLPHDYSEFETPFKARYIRWNNVAYTLSGNVSLRELRVFGQGAGAPPPAVQKISAKRSATDPCHATISWAPAPGAEGYVVRYGIAPDKLYTSIHVLGKTTCELTALTAGQAYVVTVDAFNAAGVSEGQRAGGPEVRF